MSCGDGSCGLISHITGSGYCSGPRLHSGSGVIGCVGLSWNDRRGRGGGGGRELSHHILPLELWKIAENMVELDGKVYMNQFSNAKQTINYT